MRRENTQISYEELVSAFDLSEETRCGYTISNKVKQIWKREIEILLYFDSICKNNNIRYYAMFGTLLGAIRHGGFIPWDDDIDLAISRKDYNFLVKNYKKFETTKFKFNFYEKNSNSYLLNLRIVDISTSLINSIDFDKYCGQGIGVDIVALDEVSDVKKEREKQNLDIQRLQDILFTFHYGNKTEDPSYKFVENIDNLMLFDTMKNICQKHRGRKYLKMFLQPEKEYSKVILNKDDFNHIEFVRFENITIPVPIGYKRILKKIYGKNYMELPPQKNRIPRHILNYVNVDIPYDETFKHFNYNFNDMKDRKLIVFGAGKMFEHFIKNKAYDYPPFIAVDNNKSLWGNYVFGVKIYPPNEILKYSEAERRILICSTYYKEIEEQLINMNVNDYYFYVQKWEWI